MIRYPVLPMWQPFASLTFEEAEYEEGKYKKWETRSKKPPLSLVGKGVILIHACAKFDKTIINICKNEEITKALDFICRNDGDWKEYDVDNEVIPFGKIIGGWQMGLED